MTVRLIPPAHPIPLDPGFRPAALFTKAFKEAIRKGGVATPCAIAIEQADGSRFHFQTEISSGEDDISLAENFRHLERYIKFLLWSRGGFRVYLDAPPALVEKLKSHYRETPTGRFDAEIMGGRIYEKPLEILNVTCGNLPPPYEATKPLGRHLNGCRIGFDLGASDRKTAAVIDGKVVFSDETPWDPSKQNDPSYHFEGINDSLQKAAAHLPRVDAIGGSAAGVYVNNKVKVASLFRSVPKESFDARVKDIFLELRRRWKNVPLEVVNDGEVTALAGSMSLNDNSVLGISLGSSQAAGYVTKDGNITSWLNELAFAPVDYSEGAPVDEWSGDRGCGVQYFSQQCVARLVPVAGIEVDPLMVVPDRLKYVQELMAEGDQRAKMIYETIGAYLGYAIGHYADFYDIRNVLILGRVTTGEGGAVIMKNARQVLEVEFPMLGEKVSFHTPDERNKRHGQAIAAASLPAID